MVHKLRTMTVLELTAFLEVVKCGGITPAAEKLNLAKSGVSGLLKRFEQRLNVKLLERSSRRMSLTKEGEHLVPKVESLLAECEQLLQQAERQRAEPHGIVQIAATPEFGGLAVSVLAPLLRARYPEIKLLVKPAYAMEDMQDPAFDFAIRIGQVADENLVARALGTSHRLLVCSPEFFTQNTINTLSDLEQLACLLFSSRSYESVWSLLNLQSNERERVKVHSQVSIQSLSTVLELCRQGQGVAMLPEFLVREELAKGALINCLPNYRSDFNTVYLVYRRGIDKIMRVKAVMDIARESLPALLSN
ncbi:DNA-binding transcriptional regulator, LysR family [Alteromonadaceae bacterium Bs31]|nr:DNA-binding transcriptional regulator, LysR family [Alteromonadaceae bacterium Bs31]